MITGRLIVCIGSNWDYDPTSKHHIMKRLSEAGNRVLWINYHASRRPNASAQDVRHAWRALRQVCSGLRRVHDGLYQLTPLVIPGASGGLLQRLHRRLMIAQLRRAVRRLDPSGSMPVQVWSFAPDVPFLRGVLGEERFVYYCVDEFSLFEGFDANRIRREESLLLSEADVVVTTSLRLYRRKRRQRPDCVLVRHGVDFSHFARAWRERLPRPSDLAEIPRPIFGHIGLVEHWIDLEHLAEVARGRPFYSFVMIGDCRVDVSALEGLDNVYFLGRRDYASLPAYCGAFDAGLMLFKRTAMTRHVNPIKMLEYLAAGLPVVSTPLPEAERYPAAIRIAEGARPFARQCDAVLADQLVHRRAEVAGLVAEMDWSVKVEQLSALVSGSGGMSAARSRDRAEVKVMGRPAASRGDAGKRSGSQVQSPA